MTTSLSTPTSSWPARLLSAAAAGGVAITLAHPSATRQFTWPWVFLLLLVWMAPLITIFFHVAGCNPWTRLNPLLGTGFALLASVTLLSAALSPFAPLSLLRIWPTLGGIALFLWLHNWLAAMPADISEARARRLGYGMAWFGGLLTLVSLRGWCLQSAPHAGLIRNDIPFGHSTYTAGAMLLVLPWLVYAALNAGGIRRAGWTGTAVVAFLALLATSSRGGVLGIVLVGTLAAGIVVARAPLSRRTRRLVAIGAVSLLMLAVLTNPRLRELVRHGGWGDTARESNTQRSAMLDAAGRLGAARPWIGWGPGTVPLTYPMVRDKLDGSVDNVLQLHNTPAQLWATLGGSGLLALILLATATMRRLGQLARECPSASPAFAAAASLAGYALFALTDHQLDLPAMNILLVLSLAQLFREVPAVRIHPAGGGLRWFVLLASVAILALPLVLTVCDLFARHAYEQSLILFERGHPAEGLDHLRTAARWAPADPYYRHQLAGRLLGQRHQTLEPTSRTRLTALAVAQLEQSLATGCLQEFARLNLGWLALESPRPAQAIPHFLAAAREAPHRSGVYFGLALALREAGHEAAAVRAFALEWLNDPVAFTAPVWEWPDFAPLRPSVFCEANRLLNELSPTYPAARYVQELWAWWNDDAKPPGHGYNAETRAFIQALAGGPPDRSYPWGRLQTAWRQSPDRAALASLALSDGAFAAALVQRAARHPPPDWRGFLTAGVENSPALLLSQRSTRTGYGVLALHPDGPVLTDLYVKQTNRLISTFASTLFPPKGWIPALELLQRLPAPP